MARNEYIKRCLRRAIKEVGRLDGFGYALQMVDEVEELREQVKRLEVLFQECNTHRQEVIVNGFKAKETALVAIRDAWSSGYSAAVCDLEENGLLVYSDADGCDDPESYLQEATDGQD